MVRSNTRHFALLILNAGLAALITGCERPSPEAKPRDPATDLPQPENSGAAMTDYRALSPAETVEKAHQHRVEGKLVLLGRYLMPDQRAAVIELIQVVDGLELANGVLQVAARKQHGRAAAQTIRR